MSLPWQAGFVIIGHRGLPCLAPENTLASFQKAIEQRFSCVEFDVQMTQDGHLVVFHDETLERTTNGSGRVEQHTLAELKKLEAGSWFSPAFLGTRIPTLREVLSLLAMHRIQANIELKPSPARRDLFLEAFEQALRPWPPQQPLPLVSSFDHLTLERFHKQRPDIALGYLVESLPSLNDPDYPKAGQVSLHCSQNNSWEAIENWAKHPSLALLVYTVNEATYAKLLGQAGVRGVFTDQVLI